MGNGNESCPKFIPGSDATTHAWIPEGDLLGHFSPVDVAVKVLPRCSATTPRILADANACDFTGENYNNCERYKAVTQGLTWNQIVLIGPTNSPI